MMTITYCEPSYQNGYWKVEVIREFTPNWLQSLLLGMKPTTDRKTYTQLTHARDYVSTTGWREQPSGEEVELFDLGFRLDDHVQKWIDRIKLERLQEQEIMRQKEPT